MAKFDKDSTSGTISIVVVLSLICSLIVAGSAVLLKAPQEEQKQLDKQKNILSVAGLLQPQASAKDVQDIYAKNIQARCVELDSGNYVECPANFDAKVAVKSPETSKKLDPSEDFAGIRDRANLAEIYLVKDDNGKTTQVILPMYGKGLWSVMYGFISVQPDGNTVNGITFYEHGETPGLGGEIENPVWQSQFKDKKLFDEQGEAKLYVGKGAKNASKDHGIDGISGSTLTSNGVSNMFKFWLGKSGFAPYLAKFKAEAN